MRCPRCRKRVAEVEELAGQRVSCPHCHRRFTMPGDPAPILVGRAWYSVSWKGVLGAVLLIFFIGGTLYYFAEKQNEARQAEERERQERVKQIENNLWGQP